MLTAYCNWAPTGFDILGLNADRGDAPRGHWLVCPVSVTRDTEEHSVDASNFAVLRRILRDVDPEGTDHECHRFGHWGCGWFEIILVRPDTAAAREAEECAALISEVYPVLDDSDLSARETEAQDRTWGNASLRDRADYARGTDLPVMALRHGLDRLCREYPDAYSRITERLLSC